MCVCMLSLMFCFCGFGSVPTEATEHTNSGSNIRFQLKPQSIKRLHEGFLAPAVSVWHMARHTTEVKAVPLSCPIHLPNGRPQDIHWTSHPHWPGAFVSEAFSITCAEAGSSWSQKPCMVLQLVAFHLPHIIEFSRLKFGKVECSYMQIHDSLLVIYIARKGGWEMI